MRHLTVVPLLLMTDAMSVVKRGIILMTAIAIAVEEAAGHGLDHIPHLEKAILALTQQEAG